ncbi:zinc ribbon-containing protein [Paraburkholderia dilworthii]|uniref:zinc ribbon-containing protein n=1 Tax=Paraburkholderia dilworthii TaxID=948106 RepID=UPI000481E58C|nr:alpha helical protein [Paraburkholderia dilworthii]
MTAHAGEKAEKTGDFRCAKCHHSVHVQKGHSIPKCPNCGSESYSTRVREPGNKSSS